MGSEKTRKTIVELLQDGTALEIEGGFSKSANFLVGESVMTVSNDLDDPAFDPTAAGITLKFLEMSRFSSTCSGTESFDLGIRTPGLLSVRKEVKDGHNYVIHEADRCHSEKLYSLLRRVEGQSFDCFIDETENLINDHINNKVALDRQYSVSELLRKRRSTSIVFYKYLTEVFMDIIVDSEHFKGTAVDYLEKRRERFLFGSEEYSKHKKMFDEDKDSLCLELASFLDIFEERSHNKPASKMVKDLMIPCLPELSELTLVKLNEPGSVIIHDDNNKNVLVGSDTYDSMLLYYIDYHRVGIGHEFENWYSQSIYPGQYMDLPSDLITLSKNQKEKRLKRRMDEVERQVNDYLSLRYGRDIKTADAMKEKVYAIFTRWAIRDSSLFCSNAKPELCQGFMQYAIECASMLNNTDNSYVPNLRKNLLKIYSDMFHERYQPTEKKIR